MTSWLVTFEYRTAGGTGPWLRQQRVIAQHPADWVATSLERHPEEDLVLLNALPVSDEQAARLRRAAGDL